MLRILWVILLLYCPFFSAICWSKCTSGFFCTLDIVLTFVAKTFCSEGMLHLPLPIRRWCGAMFASLQTSLPLEVYRQVAPDKCNLSIVQVWHSASRYIGLIILDKIVNQRWSWLVADTVQNREGKKPPFFLSSQEFPTLNILDQEMLNFSE